MGLKFLGSSQCEIILASELAVLPSVNYLYSPIWTLITHLGDQTNKTLSIMDLTNFGLNQSRI